MKIIVAIRTHYWDKDIAFLYDMLVKSVDQRYEVYLLCDESKGCVEVPQGVRKIGFKKSILSVLDLLDFPVDRSIWRNGDYALYILRRLVPDGDAYLLLENDVLAKSQVLFEKIGNFFEGGGDLVMSAWNPGQANPVGRVTARDFYPTGTRYGFMHIWLWGATTEVADRLWQERRLQSAWHRPGAENSWPSDEVFLGTFFHNHKAYDILQLRDQLGKDVEMHLGFSATLHVFDDNYIYEKDNLLIHPVLKSQSIFDKRWWGAKLGAEFHGQLDYTLATGYGRAFHLTKHRQATYNQLIKGVIRHPNSDPRDFAKYASEHGLTHPNQIDFANKALLKPVTLSSCQNNKLVWEADGASLTDGNYDSDKYRFGGAATTFSDYPWMTVDLMSPTVINSIKLYHRSSAFERTKHLEVLLSLDGEHYESLKKDQKVTFEKQLTDRNQSGEYYVYQLTVPGRKARYIKLQLLETNMMFHLNQIEVY